MKIITWVSILWALAFALMTATVNAASALADSLDVTENKKQIEKISEK